MKLIALSAFTLAMCWGSVSRLHAQDLPPKSLREPLLGLQFDPQKVSFERLPAQEYAKCPTLVDRETIRSHWYIFAKARGKLGEELFVAGGYSIRLNPSKGMSRYEVDAPGVVFSVENGHCTVFEEPARTMFDPFLAGEIAPDTLDELANDHMMRLTGASGGKRQLKAALENRGIALDRLPPAMRKAYASILSSTAR